MKQPKSLSSMRNKTVKRALFPSFRQSRQLSKMQELEVHNKSSILAQAKLLPFEVIITPHATHKPQYKFLLATDELTLNSETLTIRKQLKLAQHQWVQLQFTGSMDVKVKKFGDDGVFGRGDIVWDRNSAKERIANVARVSMGELVASHTGGKTESPEEKRKQMKNFVATMMGKKVKRATEGKMEKTGSGNIVIERGKVLSRNTRNRFTGFTDKMEETTLLCSNLPGSASTEINLNSKRPIKNPLQSEHETTTCDPSPPTKRTLHLHPLPEKKYERNKLRFDSQPYFHYQPSTISINPPSINNETTLTHHTKNQPEMKREMSCFQDKSEHQSEEQESVVEEIGKSRMQQNAEKEDQLEKVVGVESSGELCESREVSSRDHESSGSLYQSRYE